MAESNDEYISARANSDLKQRIEDYKDTHPECDTQTDAVVTLVQIGLRESGSPLMYRLKDSLIDYAGNLGIAAVIVLLAGFTTPIMQPRDAAVFAIGLTLTAVFLVALQELTRLATGHNEVGEHLHTLLARGGNQ